MKIYDCKCDDCKAEFQAVLAEENDKVKCPACDSEKVAMNESDTQVGCSGGCSGCSGSCE